MWILHCMRRLRYEFNTCTANEYGEYIELFTLTNEAVIKIKSQSASVSAFRQNTSPHADKCNKLQLPLQYNFIISTN